MRKFSKFILLLMIICLSLSFVACGSNPAVSPDNSNEVSSSTSNYDFVIEGVGRKLIYTVDINLTVEKLSETGAEIVAKVQSYGGWVQSSQEQSNGRYDSRYYIVRVPTDKLNEFLLDTESKGEVMSKSVSSDDITTLYVTATARKDALIAERDALNALNLTTTPDILLRSERISKINAELGALQLELNNYDSLVNYSKVTIRLNTVEQKAVVPFGKKLGNIFKASVKSIGVVAKGLFIAFIAALPYVVLIGIVIAAVFGIRLLIKKYKPSLIKSKKQKKDKRKDENKQ